MIPGLGTSVRPALLDESYVDEVVMVAERRTPSGPATGWPAGFPVRRVHRNGCQRRHVVAGAARRQGLTAVAIAPDLGERYLDTVYQSNWVRDLYGDHVFAEELAAGRAR